MPGPCPHTAPELAGAEESFEFFPPAPNAGAGQKEKLPIRLATLIRSE